MAQQTPGDKTNIVKSTWAPRRDKEPEKGQLNNPEFPDL